MDVMSCIIDSILPYQDLPREPMSIQYVRPKSISEALEILSAPNSIPLAGGTRVNTPDFKQKYIQQPGIASFTLVDLQSLGLDQIKKHGDSLEVDACVTLQALYDNSHTTENLKQAIRLEAPLNIRNTATVVGTLVASDGRSPFTTALLAMDAKMNTIPGDEEVILGNYLPMRGTLLPGRLITKIFIPLNIKMSFEYASRTKYDRPIVCVALAQWKSGRTRLALGGYGTAPLLALDGTADDDIKSAARNGYHEAADKWASAEYRADVAATLAGRCVNK
jgi:CO/xanthine dehydrogenase FAD-binding subunit